MCLALIVRNKFSTIQNIVSFTKKLSAIDLGKCYCYQPQGVHIYRLQNYSISNDRKDVAVSDGSSGKITTGFEAVKKTTKTVWYGTIVLIGLGFTTAILYELFKELFSGNNPNNIYSQACDRCIKDEKVIFALGEPVKGYKQEIRRGRRQHVSYWIYEKDGFNYMRMKFYLKGSRKTATAHLEMKENERGNYEYRYLFLQVDEYPHTTIILEDNRSQASLKPLSSLNESADLVY